MGFGIGVMEMEVFEFFCRECGAHVYVYGEPPKITRTRCLDCLFNTNDECDEERKVVLGGEE
jgi:hypothetical protein